MLMTFPEHLSALTASFLGVGLRCGRFCSADFEAYGSIVISAQDL